MSIKKNKILSISEKFNKAKILIENDKKVEALNDLIFIIDKKVLFYSPSALNLILEKDLLNDKKEILLIV